MMNKKNPSNTGSRGKARIIKDHVRTGAIPVLVGVTEPGSPQANQPRARLVQNEDGSTRIEVACSCGKKIVIECEYA